MYFIHSSHPVVHEHFPLKASTHVLLALGLGRGSVKSERSIMGAKRSAARLIDLETVRFTGERQWRAGWTWSGRGGRWCGSEGVLGGRVERLRLDEMMGDG